MLSAVFTPVLRHLALLLFVVMMMCEAAFAHAEFRGSTPAPDTVLDAMPNSVELRFSEDVGPLALSWRLPDGTEREARVTSAFQALMVEPPPNIGGGSYALRWRVASTDGHPVSGTLVFSVGHISSVVGTEQTGSAWLIMAARAVMTAGMIIAVGAAVFGWLISPIQAGIRRIALAAAALTYPAAAALLAAEGLDRLGLPSSALLSLQPWSEGLGSPAVASIILAVGAATLAAFSIQWRSTVTLLVAWITGALSFGVSGHAMSSPMPGVPLTIVHAAAQIFWIGGLIPLAAAVHGQTATAQASILRRFSLFALPAVVALLLSGGGLILMHNPGWSMLATAWAQLLSVKLLLVAMMLALAYWHRSYATPRLQTGHTAPVRATLTAEIAIGFLVLALAMGFRVAPPSASEKAVIPGLHLHGEKSMADLTFSEAPPGSINIEIALSLTDAKGEAKEVSISFFDPVTGLGPIESVVRRVSPGLWKAGPNTLPTPGPWEVTLTVLISDFEQERLGGTWPEINKTGRK
jgi:copper transport protein